jgi:poly [ADP-ribose] polymerase
MITRDNGLRYAKLIHVSVDNGSTAQSNKVYIMEEESTGKIKCEYGRVGQSMTTVYKSSHEWNKVYKSKVNPRKGYTDVTDMIVESVSDPTINSTSNSKTVDIKCQKVRSLFNDLMSFANKSIQKNYKVTQESVTETQVNAAQEVIDRASAMVVKGMDVKGFNKVLIELYTIIPRNMKDVRDYLANSSDTDADIKWVNEFLSSEQDTLDTMAGQVKLLKQQKSVTVNDDTKDTQRGDEITILEQMGLEVSEETDSEKIALINKLAGSNAHKIRQIYKTINNETQLLFDKDLKLAKNKKRRLYWHGSRSENWFNILQSGLLIRPSGAVHTGSMWDDGIYYASSADKSLGYTNGGRWASGSNRTSSVYLGLFDVRVGKQLVKDKHDSSCYRINEQVKKGGYDSVHAKKGPSLRKDEFIVYNSKQSTIAYLVEFEY